MGIGHEYRGEKIFQGAAKQCHCVLFLSALPVFVARVKQDLRELRYLLDSADASSAPIRSLSGKQELPFKATNGHFGPNLGCGLIHYSTRVVSCSAINQLLRE